MNWPLMFLELIKVALAVAGKIATSAAMQECLKETFEFLHNSKFPANSYQDPASIDIQWVVTIECQSW